MTFRLPVPVITYDTDAAANITLKENETYPPSCVNEFEKNK